MECRPSRKRTCILRVVQQPTITYFLLLLVTQVIFFSSSRFNLIVNFDPSDSPYPLVVLRYDQLVPLLVTKRSKTIMQ
jgi:hypothetical protein